MIFFCFMKNIKLIFTRSANNIIGRENDVIWYLSNDVKDFSEKTSGHIVLMGMKTWENTPSSMKPFPNRHNVVLTRDNYFNNYSDNIEVANDLDTYIQNYQNDQFENRTLWINGGGEILFGAIKYANEIHVTELLDQFEGDVTGPEIDPDIFRLNYSSEVIKDSFSGLEYYRSVYSRI